MNNKFYPKKSILKANIAYIITLSFTLSTLCMESESNQPNPNLNLLLLEPYFIDHKLIPDDIQEQTLIPLIDAAIDANDFSELNDIFKKMSKNKRVIISGKIATYVIKKNNIDLLNIHLKNWTVSEHRIFPALKTSYKMTECIWKEFVKKNIINDVIDILIKEQIMNPNFDPMNLPGWAALTNFFYNKSDEIGTTYKFKNFENFESQLTTIKKLHSLTEEKLLNYIGNKAENDQLLDVKIGLEIFLNKYKTDFIGKFIFENVAFDKQKMILETINTSPEQKLELLSIYFNEGRASAIRSWCDYCDEDILKKFLKNTVLMPYKKNFLCISYKSHSGPNFDKLNVIKKYLREKYSYKS